MSSQKIEKQAFEYFKSGYYCSEAVFRTITEDQTKNVDSSLSRLTSGLLGGMGSSHEEACGALTGGIIALGFLYGRTNPDDEIPDLIELVMEFKKRFNEEFGTTNCGILLDQLGEQGDDYTKCRELTAKTAGILADIIDQHQKSQV